MFLEYIFETVQSVTNCVMWCFQPILDQVFTGVIHKFLLFLMKLS